jgi:hypothetical protein
MGIKPCSIPHNSLHIPLYNPILEAIIVFKFIRPGIASTFKPKPGIAQLCATSFDVIKNDVFKPTGIEIAFVVTNKRV